MAKENVILTLCVHPRQHKWFFVIFEDDLRFVRDGDARVCRVPGSSKSWRSEDKTSDSVTMTQSVTVIHVANFVPSLTHSTTTFRVPFLDRAFLEREAPCMHPTNERTNEAWEASQYSTQRRGRGRGRGRGSFWWSQTTTITNITLNKRKRSENGLHLINCSE